MKEDIKSLKDVQNLVDTFYSQIRKDELLGEIFDSRIGDKWPQHLDKMYRFWETVLLDKHTYSGSPFVPHARMPIDYEHFGRWLQIFTSTVDQLYVGEKAERAKWQGERMAEMFLHKIRYYRDNDSIPLL